MDGEAAMMVTMLKDHIAEDVMLFLDLSGRVASLEAVLLSIEYNCQSFIQVLEDYEVEFDLMKLIEEYDAFYYFELGGFEYLSLSRNYHYINTRLSLYLSEVEDKSRESLLQYNVSRTVANTTVRGRDFSFAERPSEYDYAKCALATLEILSVVRSVSGKEGRILPYKCLLKKCAKMSTLAKSALKAAYDGEWKEQLGYFLGMYRDVFMKKTVDTVYFVRLTDSLKYCAEMDLLWSYAGICICNGLTDITELSSELKVFIKKAKFNYVMTVDEDHLKRYLRARTDLCMLPGDGRVWRLQPLSEPADIEKKIADLFVQYLTDDKAFNYMDCYSVLRSLSPDIARCLKDKSPIPIASFLYSDLKTFSFTNGLIALNRNAFPVLKVRQLTPVHVPFGNVEYIRLDTELMFELTEAFGYVLEVAIHSALVYFAYKELQIIDGQILTPDKIRGYCHRGKTEINGEEVMDFREYLKPGDLVKTSVSTYRHKGIQFPFHYLITSLIKVEGIAEPNQRPSDEAEASRSEIPNSDTMNTLFDRLDIHSTTECSKSDVGKSQDN